MNVLFIHSEKNSIETAKPVSRQISIQLGISYIASLLRSNGHTISLFVVCHKTKLCNLDAFIGQFRPELICFTAVFSEYDFIREVATHIKSVYPEIYLLVGGPHVSLNPEKVIDGPFDAICIGEGEWPTLELVRQLEEKKKSENIQNLWIKNKGVVEKNSIRPFLQDLDSLPFPERNMWMPWVQAPQSEHTVLLGRGCPFHCTYCCNHALLKICPGEYVRFRSVNNIIKEIDQIHREYPYFLSIYLEIETIGVNLKFTESLFEKLSDYNRNQLNPLSFRINLRITPGTNYTKLFSLMKKANITYLNIGLESGSEQTRKEILQRNYSNEDFFRAIETAKKYDIKVNVYVMIGLPGENRLEFQKTVECLRKAQPEKLFASIFFPYPGTDIYEYCLQHKLLPSKMDTQSERFRASLDLPGFSRSQIQREFILLNYKVYKDTRPLRIIYYDTRYLVLQSNVIFKFIYYKIVIKVKNGLRFLKNVFVKILFNVKT